MYSEKVKQEALLPRMSRYNYHLQRLALRSNTHSATGADQRYATGCVCGYYGMMI